MAEQLEIAEVMLAVWVVVRREGVEMRDLHQGMGRQRVRKGGGAGLVGDDVVGGVVKGDNPVLAV